MSLQCHENSKCNLQEKARGREFSKANLKRLEKERGITTQDGEVWTEPFGRKLIEMAPTICRTWRRQEERTRMSEQELERGSYA
ncbi:hypothetical protein AMTR_s00174p00061050 [Amborella trichopoda]|uniref:Uncharacterized protein n=1 Tax=Amborella trichopoda TaxID=13333 RepID=U5CZC9_AMBTC|nr:hypothetical protein AMTR_s00174p00061050 [Amborella trichopoda]